MKNYILTLCLFLPGLLAAQGGKVYDELALESEILGGTRKFAIYLPPDYEHSKRSYPVLYLLHGSGDDQTGWIQFGEVLHITDKAIREGKATPMIIVMPDADSGHRGYANRIGGKWNYEDFFFEELIPHIESRYRAKSAKRYRAVAGLSMGGGGTLMYAMHRPDLFAAACPLSASAGPIGLSEMDDRWMQRRGYEAPINENEKEAWFQRYSTVYLAETLPEENLKSVRWYIDCGDDDFLFEGNSLLHIAFSKRKIPHEYRVRNGDHSWSYWRSALPEVLAFVTVSFHQR